MGRRKGAGNAAAGSEPAETVPHYMETLPRHWEWVPQQRETVPQNWALRASEVSQI
jgi:hypothetical protein